ncbi:MAG: heme/copper-type cytochrome/quinol oxidase subunit 4 [Patescibacteria group bacterium]|jgi:heme/copper-type cytochrome/quinol oxidase subunit 4
MLQGYDIYLIISFTLLLLPLSYIIYDEFSPTPGISKSLTYAFVSIVLILALLLHGLIASLIGWYYGYSSFAIYFVYISSVSIIGMLYWLSRVL